MTTEETPFAPPKSDLQNSSDENEDRVEKIHARLKIINLRFKILTGIFIGFLIFFAALFLDPSESPEEFDKNLNYYILPALVLVIAQLVVMFRLAKILERNKWVWSILSIIFPPWSIVISYLIMFWNVLSEKKKERSKLDLYMTYQNIN